MVRKLRFEDKMRDVIRIRRSMFTQRQREVEGWMWRQMRGGYAL